MLKIRLVTFSFLSLLFSGASFADCPDFKDIYTCIDRYGGGATSLKVVIEGDKIEFIFHEAGAVETYIADNVVHQNYGYDYLAYCQDNKIIQIISKNGELNRRTEIEIDSKGNVIFNEENPVDKYVDYCSKI